MAGLSVESINLALIKQISENCFEIQKGFVPKMLVPCRVYISEKLLSELIEEVEHYKKSQGSSFIPALFQLANVASLPGIIGYSIGLPDIHAGYGFAIGNVAAFNIDSKEAIISPGGIGYDINCGVRVLRTDLYRFDFKNEKFDSLADELFRMIPVGVGAKSDSIISQLDIKDIVLNGMSSSCLSGIIWEEDRERTEHCGHMPCTNFHTLSQKAISLGRSQLGTLGSGNHYVEVQIVDEIYDKETAKTFGIDNVGQILISIHCGSRGLGHQVATGILYILFLDYIKQMENFETQIEVNDKQLTCTPFESDLGQRYMNAMYGACNFAYANRSIISKKIRGCFEEIFNRTAKDMGMELVYDVSHNIANIETHFIDGKAVKLLVHRKGSTRALPAGHPELPSKFLKTGQPVFVGGSMGTCSFILAGIEGNQKTYLTTCHGAGRKLSRRAAKKDINGINPSHAILENMQTNGIILRASNLENIAEEGPMAYKDVLDVVEICK